MIKADTNSPAGWAGEIWFKLFQQRDGVAGYHPKCESVNNHALEVQVPQMHERSATSNSHSFATDEQARDHIKEKALEFGADAVGVTEIRPTDLYNGSMVSERYAIAIAVRMDYREFQTVPAPECGLEVLEAYNRAADVSIKLCEYIRELGYIATAEHAANEGIMEIVNDEERPINKFMAIPIAERAGLGELGRHGSLIHPELGPFFRLIIISTALPTSSDSPIDSGIGKFCDACRACRIYCPADAIPDKRLPEAGKDSFGNDRYKIDTGKCYPYFKTHDSCSVCLAVCVYQRKKWARNFVDDGPVKKFPEVLLGEALGDYMPPFDEVPPKYRHSYPKLDRGIPKKLWPKNIQPSKQFPYPTESN